MPDAGTKSLSKKPKRNSLKIGEILRKRLATNFWRPNDQLPTEKELAAELNACPATIQRHLRELQQEGLIVGRRGKGRFVASVSQRPRTGNIGAILFDSRHLAHPMMSQMVMGIGEVAAEARRNLSIFAVNELAMQEPGCVMPLMSDSGRTGLLGSPVLMGLDGVIILTQRIKPDVIRQLAGFMPVVCAHALAAPNVSCIVLDATSASFMSVRHLIELGHRSIALLVREVSDAFGQAAREGARMAMVGKGKTNINHDLHICTASEFSQAEGYRLCTELLRRHPQVTGIISSDDGLARGAIQAIEQAGLRMPEDISLITWNDTLINRYPVSITSAYFDMFGAGVKCTRRLLECIEHPGRHFDDEYLLPTLTVRQSTAQPRTFHQDF